MGWDGYVIGISVALIAIAFVVLVIFLVRALLELKISLHSTNKLIEETHEVLVDVERKIHSFDPLFKMVDEVGETLKKHTPKVQHLTEEVCHTCIEAKTKAERTTNVVMDAVEWGLMGVALWQKFKSRR